jgi:hypothetical protein
MVCPWPPLHAWAPNPMASNHPVGWTRLVASRRVSITQRGGTIRAFLRADARAADPRTWLPDRTTLRNHPRTTVSAHILPVLRSVRVPSDASFCAAQLQARSVPNGHYAWASRCRYSKPNGESSDMGCRCREPCTGVVAVPGCGRKGRPRHVAVCGVRQPTTSLGSRGMGVGDRTRRAVRRCVEGNVSV